MVILEFIFQSFWVFIGCVILIAVIGDFFADIIKAMLSPWKKDFHYHVNDVEVDIEKFKEWIENVED